MLNYVVRRLMVMVPTLIAISALVFIIIQLPPGDYLETYITELQSQGEAVDPQKIEHLRKEYGLDRPFYEQYFFWVFDMVQGDRTQAREDGRWRDFSSWVGRFFRRRLLGDSPSCIGAGDLADRPAQGRGVRAPAAALPKAALPNWDPLERHCWPCGLTQMRQSSRDEVVLFWPYEKIQHLEDSILAIRLQYNQYPTHRVFEQYEAYLQRKN